MLRPALARGNLPALLLAVSLFPACADVSPREAEQASTAAVRTSAYRFELKARSTENPFSGAGAYQLPDGAFIKNQTPSINDQGDLVLDFRAFDNLQHVWKNGRIIHDVPDSKAVIAETSINAAGDVAFDVMGGESNNGVFVHRAATGQTSFFSAEPLGAESWINVALLDDGRVGCRPGVGGSRALGIVHPDGFTRLAIESSLHPSSPYEYIFSPRFDRRGNAAVKVMLASGGEQIRLFAPGGGSTLLAEDKAANETSQFSKLDNGLALNGAGQVAFVAKVGAKRAVFRTNGAVTTRIAIEGEGGIGTIAYFNPVLNDAGTVVFKGEDGERRNTIWVGDGDRLERLATAGDSLPSDRGTALALPETGADPNNRVVFGGGLAINARGEIVFSAALAQVTEGGSTRLGTGVYVAVPTR